MRVQGEFKSSESLKVLVIGFIGFVGVMRKA